MRIIPPEPPPTTQSHGEHQLHRALREAVAQPDEWIEIHSLALAPHGQRRSGEADFVLIGAPGIYVLEVKGGTISRRDGRWFSTDRHDHVHPLTRSPFVQAQDAAHAMIAWLTDVLPEFASWRVRFGYGVAFPDSAFPYTDPGWDQAQILTRDHLHTTSGIEYFLSDFAQYWAGKLPYKAVLTPARIAAIVNVLAGDFGRQPRRSAAPEQQAIPTLPRIASDGQRADIVDFLRADLVGPWLDAHEVLPDNPLRRYVAGVLFPRPGGLATAPVETDADPRLPDVSRGEASQEDQSEQAIAAAYARLPSTLGVSFVMTGVEAVRVQIRAATYGRPDPASPGETPAASSTPAADPGDDQRTATSAGWHRQAHVVPALGEALVLRPGPNREFRLPVLDGRATLIASWRRLGQGTLVTVSLANTRIGSDDRVLADPAACLFQVELQCFPVDGNAVAAYPPVAPLTDDWEEHELSLIYRRHEQYAIGHGCGAHWHRDATGVVTTVQTATLPMHELPPVTYDLPGDATTLSFFALSDLSALTTDDVVTRLRAFAAGYEQWAAALPSTHTDIPASLLPSRDRFLARIDATATRITAGIRVLDTTPAAMRAFRLMNEAMLRQRLAGSPAAGATDLRPHADLRWRPFQLAFTLLSLPSLTDPAHPDRTLVDLLWFPTGGGKTEAYLGVIGFLLFWRRLVDPVRGGGTAAIMRYTLRLLTTQQFLRAAKLIAASEFMRRALQPELSAYPITLGLWIGNSLTPNHCADAVTRLRAVRDGSIAGNPFVLDACPWCNRPLLPDARHDEAAPIGFLVSRHAFSVRCPAPACDFHDGLPVQIVDEELYRTPPSLLLATVDKFAMVTWEQAAGVFFGDTNRRPPDLIVQDELHLIAGPLGTMVGLYETALDGIIASQGAPAKLIASTATIRGAADQVKRLYGREMQVFPPSGLTADDSYFARTDHRRPGRLYLGVMPSGISDAAASVRLSSALLQASMAVPVADREAYWTLVSYHNNLRGVGRGLSLAADEIPAQIEFLAKSLVSRALAQHSLADLLPDAAELAPTTVDDAASVAGLVQRVRREIVDAVAELTSNIKAETLGDMLSRLERPATDPAAVSLLLCTNMLSVGVDVSRLALMLVHSQPKSTAEYIQATSRVGRGDVPGLVVCLYSSLRPRDRSHFEHFVGFHSAFYREVEATPVTPFAAPARERALPAVLVSLARHRAGVRQAHEFTPESAAMAAVLALIHDRVETTDPAEAAATATQLAMLVADWQAHQRRPGRLHYGTARDAQNPTLGVPTLLAPPDALNADGWATPMSMRTVEASVPLRVIRSGQ